jgi:hypothetical protein
MSNKQSQSVIACTVGLNLCPLRIRKIDRQDEGASMCIVKYNDAFPPTSAVTGIVRNSLPEANKQLRRISSKSRKIFVLDITSYILKNENEFCKILSQEYEKNQKKFESLDGIILFSSSPNASGHSFMPVILHDGIETEVFKKPAKINFGAAMMVAISKRTPKEKGKILEIEKGGNIKIDDIPYGNFWDCLKLAEESDGNIPIHKNKRRASISEGIMFTHVQRFRNHL